MGGIGSASIVLALRSSMENFVGGILLKFQDKFRVGEKISVSLTKNEAVDKLDLGTAEEINLLYTRIRRDDDSYANVPNAQFIQGEVINWSRTPYRLFTTSIAVNEKNLTLLPKIIEQIHQELQNDPGVETQQRELIIAANGFVNDKIMIEIQVRLKGSDDQELSIVKTRVVNKIAQSLNKIYLEHPSTTS